MRKSMGIEKPHPRVLRELAVVAAKSLSSYLISHGNV